MESFHNYCSNNKKTVCTVESCTAGLLANKFTTFSGASKWFKGGFVVYTDEIKSKLLDIGINEIRKNGAVTSDMAKKMCRAGKEKFETDICIAVTGYIEPSKDAHCYIAIMSDPTKTQTMVVYKLKLNGETRQINQRNIVSFIIDEIEKFCIL